MATNADGKCDLSDACRVWDKGPAGMAGTVIMSLPVLALFAVVQRQILRAVTSRAL